jgi:hypothetical protein
MLGFWWMAQVNFHKSSRQWAGVLTGFKFVWCKENGQECGILWTTMV